MTRRRKAREALLKALYIGECRGITVARAFDEMETVDREMAEGPGDPDDLPLEPFGLGLDKEEKEFALSLAETIGRGKDIFDERIAAVLENWDLSRVSRIDRYIMWIALAETSSMPDIPVKVSLNEAIELARSFSSEKSTGFINGVLDAVMRDMGIIKRDG
ncbi:MAG: transcription antitermination factor NusB [Candidatus Latescibacteria bacterium]|nr:transcription antitermination factor NusB [Candidatus Latescibacterota bacterium]